MKVCWDEVGAVSVGGWYANRAFRHDRDPGFDPANDEVRDPFEFGAVQDLRLPESEHRRGGKAESPRHVRRLRLLREDEVCEFEEVSAGVA
ncbi:hypothetical protein FMUAM8_31570 [Nocardia cyriacigeorgica]|nr:hypothetical protein FMUAM8_31570 [Nocardia cyriacigeorgica]